jgi:hypothetical protein
MPRGGGGENLTNTIRLFESDKVTAVEGGWGPSANRVRSGPSREHVRICEPVHTRAARLAVEMHRPLRTRNAYWPPDNIDSPGFSSGLFISKRLV